MLVKLCYDLCMNKKVSLLFVCVGNTCRSCMAECIVRHLAKIRDMQFVSSASAGLAVEPGSFTEISAIEALNDMGIKMEGNVAKQLTKQMCKEASLIITMSDSYKVALKGVDNVYTLAELVGGGDVGDPCGSGKQVYTDVASYLMVKLGEVLDRIQKGELV